jgi:ABC-type transporter Mla subunit MlaD
MTRWQAIRDGVILGCVVSLTFGALRLMYHVDEALASLPKSVQGVPQVVQDADATIKKVSEAADKLNAAAAKNSTYYDQAARELPKTARTLRATIDAARGTIDDLRLTTVPQLNQTVADFDGQMKVTAQTYNTVGIDLDAGLQSLNRRIADPRIDSLIGNLDTSSLHFSETSAHIDATTADLQAVADHYRKVLLTKRGFWTTVAKGAESLIVPGTNLAIALK